MLECLLLTLKWQTFPKIRYISFLIFFSHSCHFSILSDPALYLLLIYIYQSVMLAEQLEAQQNLCDFSQKTNYLVEWTEKPFNKYLKQLHKNAIKEQQEEESVHRHANKRPSDLIREVSERYNLRKYENKLEIINQIQYPLQDRQPFHQEHQYSSLKNSRQREYVPSPGLKRKGSVNSESCRVVDVEFLNRKLQLFKRKHTESQKKISSSSKHVQFKYTPKSLNIKRSPQPKRQFNQKVVLNVDQIEQIKKMITKNSRRHSIPHFNDYFALGELKL